MTIDIIFGKRFYLLIVIKLSTREIKYWDLTENPTKEFVRQRIIEVQGQDPGGKYLIHDNELQFTSINYPAFGIEGVCTPAAAPNMKTEESERSGQVNLAIAELTMGATTVNAYVECVFGTIRREALDHYLLFSERQIRNVVSEYIEYYNRYRPHQGIERIPSGRKSTGDGKIVRLPILSGLHHNYYGSSA